MIREATILNAARDVVRLAAKEEDLTSQASEWPPAARKGYNTPPRLTPGHDVIHLVSASADNPAEERNEEAEIDHEITHALAELISAVDAAYGAVSMDNDLQPEIRREFDEARRSAEGMIIAAKSGGLRGSDVAMQLAAVRGALDKAIEKVATASHDSTTLYIELKAEYYGEAYQKAAKALDKEWGTLERASSQNNAKIDSIAGKYGIDMSPFRDQRKELEDKIKNTHDRVEKSLLRVDMYGVDLDAADYALEEAKKKGASAEHLAELERAREKAAEQLREAQRLAQKEIDLKREAETSKTKELTDKRAEMIKTGASPEEIAALDRELGVRAASQEVLNAQQLLLKETELRNAANLSRSKSVAEINDIKANAAGQTSAISQQYDTNKATSVAEDSSLDDLGLDESVLTAATQAAKPAHHAGAQKPEVAEKILAQAGIPDKSTSAATSLQA